MDNIDIEKTTKNILAKSKMELNNPDFSKLIMNKIQAEESKQFMFRNLFQYFLIFVAIDTIIFSLLKLINIRISDIPIKLSTFINGIFSAIHQGSINIHDLLIIYFSAFAVIILIISIISNSRYKYS